jgi:hypothetical protein
MKDFIPYCEALELKQLGFDEPCFRFQNNISYIIEEKGWLNWNEVEQFVSLPTFSQSFRFFRDKKYQAEILWRGDFDDFCWKIGRFKYGSHFFSENGFKTYEEAELECLKKLIEIVKQKQ